MNIIGFVKRFGDKSFKEMPFNEVDALIFSELSYINFDLAITDHKFHPFSRIHIKDKKAFYTGSVDASYNEKLVNLMMKSKRYKSLRIGFCKSCRDEKDFTQFFAFTILFPDKTGFISMRGTDTSLLGWREDFTIMYQDDMPSQEMAADYVNQVSKHFDANFYIGGHSKGGNLAIYAALHLNEKVEDRLIRVYSFDGPGFKIQGLFKKKEDRLEKFTKIIPQSSIVGVLFSNETDVKIIKSGSVMIAQHIPLIWHVKNNDFIYVNKRTLSSRYLETTINAWINSLEDEERQRFTEIVFGELDKLDPQDFISFFKKILFKFKPIYEAYLALDMDDKKLLFKVYFKLVRNMILPEKKKQIETTIKD